MKRLKARGFTLVELMTVVGIVGVLAALSAGAISGVVTNARLRGAASTVSHLLTDARALAVTQHCAHVVQLNGSAYAPTTPPAGAVTQQATVTLIRKGICTSTNPFYETNANPLLKDKVLLTQTLSDVPGVGLEVAFAVPTGVVPGDVLTGAAVAFGFASDGSRSLGLDTAGAGFVSDPLTNGANPLFTLAFRRTASDANPPRVTIPNGAPPTLSQAPVAMGAAWAVVGR